jgi:hypothetical protein
MRLSFLIKKMSLNILFIFVVWFFFVTVCAIILDFDRLCLSFKKKAVNKTLMYQSVAGFNNNMGWTNGGQICVIKRRRLVPGSLPGAGNT